MVDMDIHAIFETLPHRYPFLMVDRIVELEAGKRAVGIKNVTINEPHFSGHWPEEPVMPGVLIVEAMAQVAAKKDLPALPRLRLETYHEGLSVQVMHIGSYDDEAPTIHRMHHEFMPENGYEPQGKHHEVYLGDPRKVAPEKLKTVLRQPVRKVECR